MKGVGLDKIRRLSLAVNGILAKEYSYILSSLEKGSEVELSRSEKSAFSRSKFYSSGRGPIDERDFGNPNFYVTTPVLKLEVAFASKWYSYNTREFSLDILSEDVIESARHICAKVAELYEIMLNDGYGYERPFPVAPLSSDSLSESISKESISAAFASYIVRNVEKNEMHNFDGFEVYFDSEQKGYTVTAPLGNASISNREIELIATEVQTRHEVYERISKYILNQITQNVC